MDTQRFRIKNYLTFNLLSRKRNRVISGLEYRIIIFFAGINIIWLSLLKYKNPIQAIKTAVKVFQRRIPYKTSHPKITKAGGRYFLNLNTPGWPSKAFNRYAKHLMNILTPDSPYSLFALIFSITNKCGFRCEHCVEWDNLNKKDGLSDSDIVDILKNFHRLGISQVQFSGGEPLNRIRDLVYILDHSPRGIDYWMYTNGYYLSEEKALLLKAHGLTGVIISLDHFDQDKHDSFRGVEGAYYRALKAAKNANDNGLAVAFSGCFTNEFISWDNLMSYARLSREAGASFIQVVEPEALGHYANKNVSLREENKIILEQFFHRLNYETKYSSFPVVTYHSMVKRLTECPGNGLHFLYIDADGFVHSCPFCRQKLFHALEPELENKVRLMRERGCAIIESEQAFSTNNKKTVTKLREIIKEEELT